LPNSPENTEKAYHAGYTVPSVPPMHIMRI